MLISWYDQGEIGDIAIGLFPEDKKFSGMPGWEAGFVFKHYR